MRVGTVKELTLYPVKSMRGVSVGRAQVYWYGLNGDRKHAFVRSCNLSGFPWLTAREVPQLLLYEPYFESADDLQGSAIRVRTPDGDDLPLSSSRLVHSLSEAAGEQVSQFRLKRGTFDCMPISIITTQTLEAISDEVGCLLDARRFRANLVVEAADSGVFPEQAWLGCHLRFGDRPSSAMLVANYLTTRCGVVNLSPTDGENDARVLKAVARLAGAQAGIYGTFYCLGDIQVGDEVFVDP